MKTKTVKSLGLSGKDWIKRLGKKKYNLGSYAKEVLEKVGETKDVEYNFVILKAEDVGEYPTSREIREVAAKRGYITPPAELAPLLREAISDEEIEAMGLWWLIVMHEPITDSDGSPFVLGLSRGGDGRWLDACHGRADDGWDREDGFVFLSLQDTQTSELKTFEPSVPLTLSPSAPASPVEFEELESIALRISYKGRTYKLEGHE